MMFYCDYYYKILIGLLIGLLMGAVNFYLMRLFTRLAIRYAGRNRAVLIVLLNSLTRLFLIGVVVYWLMRMGEQMIAMIVVAVLVALTMLLAVWQQRKKLTSGK